MSSLIGLSLNRSRTILMMFVLILVSGMLSYLTIPRESSPDIPIPYVYVSVSYEGISPEDSERLLVLPLEKELQGLEGVKELSATASQSHASVTLEFDAGVELDKALADVRDKVNLAKSKLPDGTDEPVIEQITMASQNPVITAILSGNLPERAMVKIARAIKDELEAQKAILEVEIAGDREEVIDVIIDPMKLESYGLVPTDVINLVSQNNQLVAAGSMDTGQGSYSIKVPAVYKTPADILSQPVKVEENRVVTFADIATVLSTFKEGGGYARLNGDNSIALEIKKRPGENIIEAIEVARYIIDQAIASGPETLQVDYVGDQSEEVKMMVSDLQNNVLSAVILVVVIIVGALGARSALLVGIAIPGSFLSGILILGIMGLTINMVVLFSLIMAVGMLVDGAIVVTEYADRRMGEGVHRKQAYLEASRKMAWPIIASTATTLAAFFPLMFWPGMMGEFMKFLPLTLIATLASSLAMALIFIPTIGAMIGKPRSLGKKEKASMHAIESGDLSQTGGFIGRYVSVLGTAINHPGKVILFTCTTVALIFTLFIKTSRGVEFFPDVDTNAIIITVKVNSGNLSVDEKDTLLEKVEAKLMDLPGMETLYARTGDSQVVGTLRVNLQDWQLRGTTLAIAQDAEQRLSSFSGLDIAVERVKDGPPTSKPLELIVRADNLDTLYDAVAKTRQVLEGLGAFTNIEDSGPAPGYEWRLSINRAEAARYGADVATTGSMVRMVTSGLTVGSYRPDDADDEVDIRIRYPENERHLESIDQLRLMTSTGLVPIGNFTEREVSSKLDNIKRVDGKRTITISADLVEGQLLSQQIPLLTEELAAAQMGSDVTFDFKGEEEDQKESGQFLMKAFSVALFIMAMILVTQFNSFYQAALIMSAVVLATGGVFLGLMITDQNFGIVMCGIGIIALAGIVVNNNIVLIDTFNSLRKEGLSTRDAVLRTGAQRLRPVMLTTVTTVLGLMPMVLSININIFNHSIEVGAPFTQMWNQLATSIAGGLTFATLLTLVVTPCLLMLSSGWRRKAV
ncbi:efflux RND transporter permease subunit [Endozoicomonas arenosclerae]|uniref:efflux RND transporter permease subunit n=1 Tax=Endozoicomonas arenosclerae TaxID=1633495 RepID=UPI000783C74A|nr:efflux RND transporter permease subunit [Endozoicomonas arenosclerae]